MYYRGVILKVMLYKRFHPIENYMINTQTPIMLKSPLTIVIG